MSIALRRWLEGRKTYIGAAVVFATAFVLVFFGKLTPTTATAILLFALGIFSVTFRSTLAKLQNHQAEIVAGLQEVAIAGAAVASRNPSAALAATVEVVKASVKLDAEIETEAGS
jgi:hypothetical protein